MYKLKDSRAPFEPYLWLPSHSNLWIFSRLCLKTNIYINYDQCANPFKNLKEALTLSSLIISILNILTNFRHIILRCARKLNPSFTKWILQIKCVSFYNLNVIFLTNLIFPFIVIHVQLFSVVFNIHGTRYSLKKKDW